MSESSSISVLAGGHAAAMTRCADSMLRGLGGTQVILRVSGPSSGDTDSQLGLTAPVCEDVPLSPAVVRVVNPTADGRMQIKVQLSSGAVKAAAEARGVTDAAGWLLCAQGLLYRDKLLHIETVMSDHFAGSEYLFHIFATE